MFCLNFIQKLFVRLKFSFQRKVKKKKLFSAIFQFVSIYAAYLYDSVQLYAWALDKLLKQERKHRPLTDDVIHEVANNGTRIIETIIENRTYKSELNFQTQSVD